MDGFWKKSQESEWLSTKVTKKFRSAEQDDRQN